MTQQMAQAPVVYFLGNSDPDTGTLLGFIEEKVSLHRAGNLPELKQAIRLTAPDIVFCSWTFASGGWKNVIDAIGEVDSRIPVIVISKKDDAGSWFEVFKGGGFDMVGPPFKAATVQWVLHQAVESRLARNSKLQAQNV